MDYPLLNIFFTIMWLFLWIVWIFMLFRVFGDLYRDHSIGGWGKAGWTVVLIVLPFVGVLVYLIVRGSSMDQREYAYTRYSEDLRASARDEVAASNGSTAPNSRAGRADELAKLADLKNDGDITEEEYQRAKALVLG